MEGFIIPGVAVAFIVAGALFVLGRKGK